MLPSYKILHGDCRHVMARARANGIDAIVTDPPYELGFMGKKWDGSGIAYDAEVWTQALRVLKPGGYLLAFGGTRTYHRVACAIEDAGFIVRDCLQWIYGSGFPKSLDISKALDKAAGATREITGERSYAGGHIQRSNAPRFNGQDYAGGNTYTEAPQRMETAPATDLAQQWDGWGTALKPAYEPIILAQKPLEGTYAANVTKWGVGALNIAATRIGTNDDLNGGRYSDNKSGEDGNAYGSGINLRSAQDYVQPSGRWPANVMLDEAAAELLDAQSGISKSQGGKGPASKNWRGTGDTVGANFAGATGGFGDTGGASRFFYVAKASRSDRDYGCEALPVKASGEMVDREEGSAGMDNPRAGAGRTSGARNFHPTVKPSALMRQLVRLVTPAGGTILDPFAGSGSTGIAAGLEGFGFVGIELTDDYLPILHARLAKAYAVEEAAAAD